MGAYLCKMAIDGYGLRLDLTELCSGATAAICIRSLNESMRLQNGFGGNLGTTEWALEYGKRDSACTEHGLKDYKELAPKATSAFRRFRALSSQIKAVEKRMAKIAVLRTHILNYRKKQDVYVGYRQSGYSPSPSRRSRIVVSLRMEGTLFWPSFVINRDDLCISVAPTVITLFAPKNFLFSTEDCAVAAENMILAADALGVGSCYIGQGWTAFADSYGQEILQQWKIPIDHYAVMQLLLGYPREGDRHPMPKARKEGRIIRIGEV